MFVYLNVFIGNNMFRQSLINLDQCIEVSPLSDASAPCRSTLWLRHDRQVNVRETVAQISSLIEMAKLHAQVPSA